MKRLVFFSVLTVLCSNSFGLNALLGGGVNLSNVILSGRAKDRVDSLDFQKKFRLGFNGGLMFERWVSPHLSITTGLNGETRGFSLTWDSTEIRQGINVKIDSTINQKFFYLEIPFWVNVYYAWGPGNLKGSTGPEFGFLFSGKIDTARTEKGGTVDTSFHGSGSVEEDTRGFQFGWGFRLGYEFSVGVNALLFGAGYSVGLNRIEDYEGIYERFKKEQEASGVVVRPFEEPEGGTQNYAFKFFFQYKISI